jgi:hypothetical protein
LRVSCQITMKKLYLILLFIFFKILLNAQSAIVLERTVTLNLTNTSVKEALSVLAQKGRFELSYNARIIDLDKKITIITNNLTVRETLHQILGDFYVFQQKGEYLIIKKLNKPKQLVSGYISDAKTGKKVGNATVYDTKTLRSTTTDSNGFYALKVSERSTIAVARLNYRDTILQVTEGVPRFIKLDLNLNTASVPARNRVNWGAMPTKLGKFFLSPLNELNNLNVQDSIHRAFQLSLLPYIGTNHSMSGNVINNVSLNALVGYSRGNRIVELSGLGSFTRENIGGVQGSGVFNIVNGSMKGVQMTGIFNHVADTVQGMQWAGLWNYARAANALNQTSGIANIISKGMVKTQLSGVVNIADSTEGVQLSGILNTAKHIKGVQATGIYNYADTVRGIQLSGVSNTARFVKGAQVGVFNYADSLSGVQIGLINYAKNGGYNAIEVSSNELNVINVAYKSGNRKFYSAFIIGITPKSTGNIWSYGLGIGTLPSINKWSCLNIEVLYRHVNVGSYSNFRQEWLQGGFYWNLILSKHFEVGFGPTYNALFMDKSNSLFAENRAEIFPSFIKTTERGSGNLIADTWVGGYFGIRYRL